MHTNYTFRGGECSRQIVACTLHVDHGVIRRPVNQAGFVEEHHNFSVGEPTFDELNECLGPGARATTRARKCNVGLDAKIDEGQRQGERATQLQLDGFGCRGLCDGKFDELQQSAVGTFIKYDVDSTGIECARTQRQRTVGTDRNFGQRSEPLRQHSFVGATARQRRRRREIRHRAQHQRGRVGRVGMRKTADGSCNSPVQQSPSHETS